MSQSNSRQRLFYTVMSAKAATGIGNVLYCSDFRNAIVTISTTGSANMTIKCQGSIGQNSPTFTSAASPTNQWDYVQMVDLQDGNPVNGDTGVVLTGTDDTRTFEVNTNALDYITFNVTARSAGSVTITAILTDNA